MPNCAVFGCSNTSTTNISLHSFPRDTTLQKILINKCKRADEFNVKESAICSVHFEPDCYNRDLEHELLNLPIRKRRFLKEHAVPTLNLPGAEPPRARHGGNVRARRRAVNEIMDENSQSFREEKLQTERRTTTSVGTNTEVWQEKCTHITELIRLRTLVHKQRKMIAALRAKVRKPRSASVEEGPVRKKVEEVLLDIFSPGQVKCIVQGKKKVKWSQEDLKMAIVLRHMSRKAYSYLRKSVGLPLPSPSTLSSWSRKFSCNPGILREILMFLKTFLQPLSRPEKLAVLSFDEMSVRKEIVYDKAQDIVLGPCKHVQVCMLRGLVKNWKQPVFYDFDVPITKELLQQVICAVESIGAEVIACVSDMGAANMKLWRELSITEAQPWIQHFTRVDSRIFFFADVPHLLKLIRNHVLDEGVTSGGVKLDLNLFRDLLDADSAELKLCPKLGDGHIEIKGTKRMRVRPAAQLLSETTAKAITFLHPERAPESSQILTIDSFFDVFNSRVTVADKTLRSPYGRHLEEQNIALNKMYDYVKNATVVGKETRSFPFLNGVLISIKALQALLPYVSMHYGLSYVLTHRLNQDVLENLFSQIRGMGRTHDHPNAMEFRFRLRSLLLSMSRGEVAGTANSQLDDSSPFISAQIFLSGAECRTRNLIQPQTSARPTAIPQAVGASVERDVVAYIAGYVAKKLRHKHRNLGDPTARSHKLDKSWVNHLSRGGLLQPSTEWLDSCLALEAHFQNRCGPSIRKTQTMRSLIESVPSSIVCPRPAMILFLKVRFYARLRQLNRACKHDSNTRSMKKKMLKFQH